MKINGVDIFWDESKPYFAVYHSYGKVWACDIEQSFPRNPIGKVLDMQFGVFNSERSAKKFAEKLFTLISEANINWDQ